MTALNRLVSVLEPTARGPFQQYSHYQRADESARLRYATWRVSPSDRLLNDLRGLIGSEQVNWSLTTE